MQFIPYVIDSIEPSSFMIIELYKSEIIILIYFINLQNILQQLNVLILFRAEP